MAARGSIIRRDSSSTTVMKSRKKPLKKQLPEEEIDEIVESQADDDSAWGKPIQVRRANTGAIALPAELAARAAFLARVHREKNV